MDTELRFMVLAGDTLSATTILNESQLALSLASNAKVVGTAMPSIKGSSLESSEIRLRISRSNCDKDAGLVNDRVFLVEAMGSYDKVEPRRLPILEHLRTQKFDALYVLRDEVSERIAGTLYPLLYRIENGLRGYLMRFMVTQLGPRWWTVTATTDQGQKASQRKYNEIVFREVIDNKAFLIDFGDLGRMIYAQSSGFNSKEEILRRVFELEETPEAIRALKAQLQSNYQKYFRKNFKDNDFQQQWEEFEKLRNKIAHNGLFTEQELARGQEVARHLLDIIQKADKELGKVELDVSEKEAFQEALLANTPGWKVISEENFLKELGEQEQFYSSRNGFVGLAHFVKIHLGTQGYDYSTSYTLADRLQALGKVEIYSVDNPESDRKTSAIRLKG